MDHPQMNAEPEPTPEPSASIDWQDSKDTYVPLLRPLQDFLKNITLHGEKPEFGPLIFVEDSAHERMWHSATSDLSREHGGILMGEAFEDLSGRFYVAIRAAVPALESKGSPTHLQFSAESWKPIWDQLHSEPSLKIVGWYHTHPRLGVFLSGTDLRTQRLYFSAPWQIAVVIDPASRQIGYFWGATGKKTTSIRRFSSKTASLDPQPQEQRGLGDSL
jgi:proteasome lid subunit RPN8/RPN11